MRTALLVLAATLILPLAAPATELETLAALAFRNGYPLVEMATWRDNYVKVGGALNHFAHRRDLVSPSTQEAFPNVDTLYSTAWVDLSSGPVRLAVPATGSRYVTVQFISAWAETFSILTRHELDGQAANLLLTPPGWTGSIPSGTRRITCPTSLVAVWLRVFVAGDLDLPRVHSLQDQFVFQPASPPSPSPLPASFLDALGSLLPANPPPPSMRAVFAQFAPLGLSLTRGFDPAALQTDDRTRADAAVDRSRRALPAQPTRSPRRLEGGWAVYDAGSAAPATLEERILRAQAGSGGFAALPASESIYAMAYADSDGQTLRGNGHYVIVFDKASTPPVDGFWSVSVYNAAGKPIFGARHSITSETKGLFGQADGSIRVTLGPSLPLAEQQNWLPTEAGAGLRVILRLYHPRPAVFDGSWHPPLIVPAGQTNQ
jgi:hypothetical protein